jgi:hypothetical protein
MVTLEKYRGKGLDYVMAASGRIQYDSNKQKQRDGAGRFFGPRMTIVARAVGIPARLTVWSTKKPNRSVHFVDLG